MVGLTHLFYPWGLILQGIAIWHFIKRRPEKYWLWIIIFGGVLGAAIYIFAEAIPDLGLLRTSFQGIGRRSRIKALELQILDNPSAGNLEELADLYFDNKNYAQAREALNRAIAARSDSPHAFYLRAKSALAMGDYAAAIPDLDSVVANDPKFDYYRAAALLADACAHTDDLQKAEYYFSLAIAHSTTPETLYNYASYLKQSGKPDEAREWAAKLAAKKKNAPSLHAAHRTPLVPPRQSPPKTISHLTKTSPPARRLALLRRGAAPLRPMSAQSPRLAAHLLDFVAAAF